MMDDEELLELVELETREMTGTQQIQSVDAGCGYQGPWPIHLSYIVSQGAEANSTAQVESVWIPWR